MFAISPIEKHDRTKKSIPINQSVETAPVIKSSFNVRPQIWQKFNKLPNITPEINDLTELVSVHVSSSSVVFSSGVAFGFLYRI
jgi:hypothetical protein